MPPRERLPVSLAMAESRVRRIRMVDPCVGAAMLLMMMMVMVMVPGFSGCRRGNSGNCDGGSREEIWNRTSMHFTVLVACFFPFGRIPSVGTGETPVQRGDNKAIARH